jgi:hypothetical protein
VRTMSESNEARDARTNGHGQALALFGGIILGQAIRGESLTLEVWQGAALLALGAAQVLYPWPWRKST